MMASMDHRDSIRRLVLPLLQSKPTIKMRMHTVPTAWLRTDGGPLLKVGRITGISGRGEGYGMPPGEG